MKYGEAMAIVKAWKIAEDVPFPYDLTCRE